MGRTARAGASGRGISFVTQYDVELFQRIEEMIGIKMELYKVKAHLLPFFSTHAHVHKLHT